jgi:hypothetical protein
MGGLPEGPFSREVLHIGNATLATKQQGFYNPHHHAVMDQFTAEPLHQLVEGGWVLLWKRAS